MGSLFSAMIIYWLTLRYVSQKNEFAAKLIKAMREKEHCFLVHFY